MLKVIIKKNGIEEFSQSFNSQVEADKWIKEGSEEGYWGKPEHQRELTPRQVIHHDEVVQPASYVDGVMVIDEIILPAYDETIEATYETVPSEYVVEIVDCTAEVELENLKKLHPAISPRQIRLALLSQGITEAMVDAQISAMPSPDKEMAMIAWKYSTSFERFLPIVEQMGVALGFNSAALNALWIGAKDL